VQDVFRTRIPPAERARLHAAIGAVLEERYGPRADEHSSELAHHFVRAAARASAGKALRYAGLAARETFDAHDYARSAELFRRALEAKQGQEPDRLEAELLFGLGRAEALDGDTEGGLRELTRAFELFERLGEVQAAVEVATFPVALDYGYRVPFDLVERIAGRVEAGSREAALLATCRALHDFRGLPDPEPAAEALASACSFAEHAGDEALELYVLLAWLLVDLASLRDTGIAPRLDRLLSLTHKLRDLRSEALGHMWGYVHARDEMSERKHLDAALFAAERFRDRQLLSAVLHLVSMGHLQKGALNTARETLDRAIRVDPSFSNGGKYERRAAVEYETGDIEAGDRYLSSFIEAYRREGDAELFRFQTLPHAIACRARISGRPDHLDLAQSLAERLIAAPGTSPANAWMALTSAGLVAAERGDRETAARMAGRIDAMSADTGRDTDARARALIARAAGDAEAAGRFLERCLGAGSAEASPPEYAWACADFAETFGQSGSPETRRRRRSCARGPRRTPPCASTACGLP
jgi:tetratricopeptide (TPR) repeat protein